MLCGCVAPNPLVRRLGTLGDLRCGVSISAEARSDNIRRSKDASRIFLAIRSRIWSAQR
jgi:hypothetical protein